METSLVTQNFQNAMTPCISFPCFVIFLLGTHHHQTIFSIFLVDSSLSVSPMKM